MLKTLSLPKAAKEELGVSDEAGYATTFSKGGGSQAELPLSTEPDAAIRSQADGERKKTISCVTV